jgi:hypothetical protein
MTWHIGACIQMRRSWLVVAVLHARSTATGFALQTFSKSRTFLSLAPYAVIPYLQFSADDVKKGACVVQFASWWRRTPFDGGVACPEQLPTPHSHAAHTHIVANRNETLTSKEAPTPCCCSAPPPPATAAAAIPEQQTVKPALLQIVHRHGARTPLTNLFAPTTDGAKRSAVDPSTTTFSESGTSQSLDNDPEFLNTWGVCAHYRAPSVHRPCGYGTLTQLGEQQMHALGELCFMPTHEYDVERRSHASSLLSDSLL